MGRRSKLDKKQLHQALVAALESSLETVMTAQRLTAEGVTHEDARAEGLKDMRATEASYIARGQAQRAEALSADVARVRAMAIRNFSEDDPVALGALVTISEGEDEGGGEQRLFIAPAGGGERLEVAGEAVFVITPQSPMGRALVGARTSDAVEVRRGGVVHELVVEAID